MIRRCATACAAPLLAMALVAAAPAATFDGLVADAKAEMPRDPQQAMNAAGDAAALAQRERDPRRRAMMLATAQWLQGEAYNRLTKPRQALPLLRSARSLLHRDNEPTLLLGDVLLSEGSALTDMGRVTEALPVLQAAHRIFGALKEPRSAAKALIMIALLYKEARDHETALRYFADAEDAANNDQKLLMSIQNGRGTTLTALGRDADAVRAFARALPIATAAGNTPAVALLLGNIAYARLRLGQLPQARASIDRGMAVTSRPDAAAYRPQLLAADAAMALRAGDDRRAVALITRRFEGIDTTRTIIPDRDAHEIAYRIYSRVGNDAQALLHLAALKRLDDQATEIARSTGAALAAARFDYANQELRIAKLKADDLSKTVVFEREAARTQRIIFMGAVGATLVVIILLAAGIAAIRRSRDRVRAANDDLAASNLALAKALRIKTEFLATTSHEIRTPLNGILGMTQVMAADAGLDAVTRERLGVVHGAGLTMRALVDDILDVAKIESGRMTIEAAPLDLPATVEEATRLWREQAVAKGLAFTVTAQVPTRWVMGDAARLRQIIFNLMSNAVKFTAAGQVSLSLAERGDRIELVVSDTGIGIAAEAQDTIFESFRQADAGTTRQFGGTGLGLAICRNLARAMGGDVRVESRPGEGATFTLDLPLVAAIAPGAVPEQVALLIVEANPIQRAMLRSLFAHAGTAAVADDAASAAAMAAASRPGRVLVDAALVTPESLATIVEAAAPAPVHLLAPERDAARRMMWLSSGAAQVIERPIGKKALVSSVLGYRSELVPAAA